MTPLGKKTGSIADPLPEQIDAQHAGDYAASESSDQGGGARLNQETPISTTPSSTIMEQEKKESLDKLSGLENGMQKLGVGMTPSRTTPKVPRIQEHSLRHARSFADQLNMNNTSYYGLRSQQSPTNGRSNEDPFGTGVQAFQTMGHANTDRMVSNPTPGVQPRPRVVDSSRSTVNGVDAQEFYDPGWCIFVANLPESLTDTELEVRVTKSFSAFGAVFVKIRRDVKNMPYAFCQYTNAAEAERALANGRRIVIDGRVCRTEKTKANRKYVMASRKGLTVDIEEARMQLSRFGDIRSLERLDDDIGRKLSAVGGVIVEYSKFEPSRDVIATYRHNQEVTVFAYDLKKASRSTGEQNQAFLENYEKDRASIFVGQLPLGQECVEDDVLEMFSQFGQIVAHKIVLKDPKTDGGRPAHFAFIQFKRPEMAKMAVEGSVSILRFYMYWYSLLTDAVERDVTLYGSRLRVEKKESRTSQFVVRTTLPPVEIRTSRGGQMGVASPPNVVPGTPMRRAGGQPPSSMRRGYDVADTGVGMTGGDYRAMQPVAQPETPYGPGYEPPTPLRTPMHPTPYSSYYNSAQQGQASFTTPYLQSPYDNGYMAYYNPYMQYRSPEGDVADTPTRGRDYDGGEGQM
ncbi:hypothetical protein F5Y15DRAFT_412123 [Xylariaceae sp. FL0016]|nr:hypothetical protein F5Y15DRAFT_412123 [Xylariaceae sp. FL0016]